MKQSQILGALVFVAIVAGGIWWYMRNKALAGQSRPPLPPPAPSAQGALATILATPPTSAAGALGQALQLGSVALAQYLAGNMLAPVGSAPPQTSASRVRTLVTNPEIMAPSFYNY